MSILDIEFTVSRKVNPGDLERVWQVLSDVRNMPRYWRGHREVEVLRRDGNTYFVNIKFAFQGPNNRGVAKIEVNDDGRFVVINYVRGPIRGYVKNYIDGDTVVSQWKVKITPLFLVFKPWIRRHFMNGASNALARIVNNETNELRLS